MSICCKVSGPSPRLQGFSRTAPELTGGQANRTPFAERLQSQEGRELESPT